MTWKSAPTSGSDVASVFLAGVNQTTPVGAFATGSTTGITVTTSALATSFGDMVLAGCTAANNGTYTINNGFTRGISETSASFGDITSAHKVATGVIEIPSLKSSASQRQTIVGLVIKRGGDGNVFPSVSILSPANGATFTAPASITITANASDGDGTVSKVEFFQGATKLGEDIVAPYSCTWTNAVAGSYTLTARATDNAGATTTSAAVNVTVSTSISNLVTNGDFSNGMTGWFFSATSPSAGSGSVVSGQFYSDIANDDGTNWHLQLKQIGISLENGKSFTLSFDAKAQNSRNIVVQVKDGSGTSRCWATQTLSTAMQKHTVTFTNAGATGSNYQLLFFLGAQGAVDVWLDNVQLRAN